MKKLLFIFILLYSSIYAQEEFIAIQDSSSGFVVDTIRPNRFLIPKLHSINPNNSIISDIINTQNIGESYTGSYSGSTFIGFEICKGVVIYTYYTAQLPADGEKKVLLYSLNSGKKIEPIDIPLTSLFKVDKYYKFMEKYWYQYSKEAVIESYICHKTNNSENIVLIDSLKNSSVFINGLINEIGIRKFHYDNYQTGTFVFTDSSIILNKVILTLSHRMGPCSRGVSKHIPINEVSPYLNEFGKKLMNDSIYNKQIRSTSTLIENYKQAYILKHNTPNNIFLFGKIAGKYPFKMGINISDEGYETEINGSYTYDSDPNKLITLKGFKSNNNLEINEFFNSKLTGHFSLKLGNKGNVVSGTWTNADGTKTYDIEFESAF